MFDPLLVAVLFLVYYYKGMYRKVVNKYAAQVLPEITKKKQQQQ